MRIPEVREELLKIADQIGGKHGLRIQELVEELYRRPYIRKGRVKARKFNKHMRKAIRAYAERNPHLLYREIALLFNVDGARVSEALAGFRQ